VISLVLLIGIYVMVFGVALVGVALMFLSFRARGRYQASCSRVRLRQPGTPVRRQRTTTRTTTR
jgi:Na+-transporting methylmalonyl-CoA/oxaloacetate decarboxylase gamma subunit